MDEGKILELANLLRNNGDKVLHSEFNFTLSGYLLHSLNDYFRLIANAAELGPPQAFQVVKSINAHSLFYNHLQLIHDFVQKTTFLCIVHYPGSENFQGIIDITKFRSLKRLEVQKTQIKQIRGIQPLRAQIQQLVCVKSLASVHDIITECGGDNSNGFIWNELKFADFSYNNLRTVDSALEFAQYLQDLNLRHNQLVSVDAIKWLPNLQSLDLSFNCLDSTPQFHVEACKNLRQLNMSNNYVEDLSSVVHLEAVTSLDLSDNCLLDHMYLLPLSALAALRKLNLQGNPLHHHRKHRLATAQFLHRNMATAKFLLDFEPLSKKEKSVTGSQQIRFMAAQSSYSALRSTMALNISTPISSIHEMASSSVSSQASLALAQATCTDTRSGQTRNAMEYSAKKSFPRTRTVEISDDSSSNYDENGTNHRKSFPMTNYDAPASDSEHLEAKKCIETLRKKYGPDWLQSENAQMMHSVLDGTPESILTEEQAKMSRELLRDYVGEYVESVPSKLLVPANVNAATNNGTNLITSTPTAIYNSESVQQPVEQSVSNGRGSNESSMYLSADGTGLNAGLNGSNHTLYETVNSDGFTALKNAEERPEVEDDDNKNVDRWKDIYSTSTDDEPIASEPEDDEETYIVYTSQRNESMFLTISSNFLREKDTLTQRTKTKWSLKILESCDRIKSNTLRINFDTVKKDKQERVYTVEDGLCQELERKFRNILSQRNLSEMNQTIYRCVNCSCQFSMENKHRIQGVCCPDCKSFFVAEIHEIPQSLDKTQESQSTAVLSPASSANEDSLLVGEGEEANSIGSANSLNESSSCSKLSRSDRSFESNQSALGSLNVDREADIKLNCESDVDILSNPSQSSIEVLDQAHSSRKTSEERRISQHPSLETIDGRHNVKPSSSDVALAEVKKEVERNHWQTRPVYGTLAGINLTESSSSGSVTDSICTAYEQQDMASKRQTPYKVKEESASPYVEAKIAEGTREDASISTMFGALFQSTNILMSSSKKIIEAEQSASSRAEMINSASKMKESIRGVDSPSCSPYKFNYVNFNDVDHRLKLYFYQKKFQDAGEHFRCLIRGRLYKEDNRTLYNAVVVISTFKCYFMDAFAEEQDVVTKWLREIMCITLDRLEAIQLLPWKIGLSFHFGGLGVYHLLLQDATRTDALLRYFSKVSPTLWCSSNIVAVSEEVTKRLNLAVLNEELKALTLLNGCDVKCENAKRSFGLSALITTDSRLYLTSGNFAWLSPQSDIGNDIELCITQFMSNLVEVEHSGDNVFTINFLDETQDKHELWRCSFETKAHADECFNAIDRSWEKLFGVSLLTTTTNSPGE